MFSRRERLPRAAFSSLRSARRRGEVHFTALLPQGEGYAVVISKKTLPKAVDRHRLKRRILGALRTLPSALPRALIIYPKASAASRTTRELEEALTKLLSRERMP